MSRLTPWHKPGKLHPQPQDIIGHGRGGPVASAQRVIGKITQAGKSVTGTAATDLLTATAHGYAAGDELVFAGLTGGAGITAGQSYYVIASGLTANDFRVSASPGGTVLDFTTDLTAGTVARRIKTYMQV